MKDRLLAIGSIVLTLANILNWVFVAGFAIALVVSFPFAPLILGKLAMKYGAQPLGPLFAVIRAMLILGIAIGTPIHVIFTRLRAIVATAGAGDPFVAVNAARLRAIGWSLLAIQLADLLYGALTLWMVARHVDTAGWQPSLGGWLSVLMIFILARVFTIGTRMRDELAMTV